MRLEFSILTTALLLTSCASPVPRQIEEMIAKQPCCADLKAIDFAELKRSHVGRVELSEKSPVFEFEQGKSYFVAYRLPVIDSTDRIAKIKTYHVGTYQPAAFVFCPVLTFVDQNHAVVSAEQKVGLTFRRAGILEGAYWTVNFRIPQNAIYVIAHTAKAFLGKGLSSVSSTHYCPTRFRTKSVAWNRLSRLVE